MTARRIMWPTTILLALSVIALVVPGSPFYLTDLLATGWDYKLRSTAHWMRTLESEDLDERAEAIFALGSIVPPPEQAVAPLAALLESPDRNTRNQAALALSKMAPVSRGAVTALGKALGDDEHWVRMNAAMALSRLNADAKAAVPQLIEAMRDPSNDTNLGKFSVTIQQVAVLALGRATTGNADGVAALTEVLGNDTNDFVRWYAIQALGELGAEARQALPQLRALLKHPRQEIQEAAAAAVRQIEAGT